MIGFVLVNSGGKFDSVGNKPVAVQIQGTDAANGVTSHGSSYVGDRQAAFFHPEITLTITELWIDKNLSVIAFAGGTDDD